MQTTVNRCTIELVQGDLVQQHVDAIVNAANTSLLGGGGVDGAIHRAAGPELLAACRPLNGCRTGDAKITPGFKLPARFVIHAVGPVYYNGRSGEAELLASAYRRSLEVASEHTVRSIAFPAISTGIYSYPLPEAASIALRTTIAYLRAHDDIQLVRFVLWDDRAYAAFERTLHEIAVDAQLNL